MSELPVDETSPDPGPPSPQRRAHEIARCLYKQLKDRSLADRRLVLIACRAHLSDSSTERSQISLNALKVCEADEGRLSRGVYDRWRAAQPSPAEWPSSEYIRNTWNSWRTAMDAAGADVVGDVLARRLLSGPGSQFSRDEILTCIRAYAATGGTMTFAAYERWAKDPELGGRAQIPRLVLSREPVNRVFGSWTQCVLDAGLADRLLKDGVAVQGTTSDFEPKKCAEWIGAAAADCGGKGMSPKKHDEWARGRTREALQNGRCVVVPRSSALIRLFGSWADALLAGGVITENEAEARRHRRGPFTDDRSLTEWVARAIKEIGLPITVDGYTEWRQEEIRRMAQLSAPRCDARPPSEALIRRRLGGWPAAVSRARALLSQTAATHDGVEGESSDD